MMVQRYSRQIPEPLPTSQPKEQALEGEWGDVQEQFAPVDQEPSTAAYEAVNLPCLLKSLEQLIIADTGPTIVRLYQLYVPFDDPLDTGDVISNVLNPDKSVALKGPLNVHAVTDQPPGVPVYRVADLLEAAAGTA
jgi:hypothetical protein